MTYQAYQAEVPEVGTSNPQLIPYQGRPQLYIEDGTPAHLLYRIGDTWWDPTTLTRNHVPLSTMRLRYLMDIYPEFYPSQPVYVALENFWEVLATNGDRLVSIFDADVSNMSEFIDSTEDEDVIFVLPMLIPDLSRLPEQPGVLNRLPLPMFNTEWMRRLTVLADERFPLGELDTSSLPATPPSTITSAVGANPAARRTESRIPEISPAARRRLVFTAEPPHFGEMEEESLPELLALLRSRPGGQMEREALLNERLSELEAFLRANPTRSLPGGQMEREAIVNPRSSWAQMERAATPPSEEENQLESQSIDTLIRQLYGLPVTLPEELTVNGLRMPFVGFNQAAELLRSGRVQRFALEPLLQPWAGPPSSPNRIITLLLNDGTAVLVRANYDMVNNNILPPA